jgi:hypothetical protein
MTNNRVPYGLLTDEEKAALHEHEKAGGRFVYFSGGLWHPSSTWGVRGVCRTVPLPKTQDVIAWEKLPDWVEWVARDEDGEVIGHLLDPQKDKEVWVNYGRRRRIDDFPGIVFHGTCDWTDSKQRRPK